MSSIAVEQHLEDRPEHIQKLVLALHEYISGLDPLMEVAPKKLYIAYRISQNIVCVEVQKKQVLLFVKLNPKELGQLPPFARDMTNIGHFGTGDLELWVRGEDDIEQVVPYIEKAYRKIRG